MLQPENVARHSFYPFIRIDAKENRFRHPKNRVKGSRHREREIKRRPIDYASHGDALVYSWYANLISDAYESELAIRGIGTNVIAYRAIKTVDGFTAMSTAHFAQDAFTFMRDHAPCAVIALDVSKFYEEIDHDLLRQKWAQILGAENLPADHTAVFRSVTKYRFVRQGRMRDLVVHAKQRGQSRIVLPHEFKSKIIDRHLQEVRSETKGIPQGAALSCTLANVYMLDFDTEIAKVVSEVGGLYRRYSDDILIVCPPEYSSQIEERVMGEIKKLRLQIKEQKTVRRICVVNNGVVQSLDPITGIAAQIQYLGIVSDGTNLSLRHGSIARFDRRMNQLTRRAVIGAFAKGRSGPPKRLLHQKFGVPKNNFLAYAKRTASVLDAPAIPKQISILKRGRRLKKKVAAVSKVVQHLNKK